MSEENRLPLLTAAELREQIKEYERQGDYTSLAFIAQLLVIDRPTPDRLRWIETWAKGWRSFITMRRVTYYDADYYARLPLDVAVAMIEELVEALKRSS